MKPNIRNSADQQDEASRQSIFLFRIFSSCIFAVLRINNTKHLDKTFFYSTSFKTKFFKQCE
jgi:hypothetical protein